MLNTTKADQKSTQLVNHVLVDCEALLLKAWRNFFDINTAFERVFFVFILETVDHNLLMCGKLSPQVRSSLSTDSYKALKGLLEGFKIEVGWLLVQGVLGCSKFSLHFLEFTLFLAFFGILLTTTCSRSPSFLIPIQMVTLTINVANREAENLESAKQELKLSLDIADKRVVSIFWVKEVVSSWVGDLEVVQPPVEVVRACVLFLELLVLFFRVGDILDRFEDIISVLDEMLLKSHPLGDEMTFLGLLAARDFFLD